MYSQILKAPYGPIGGIYNIEKLAHLIRKVKTINIIPRIDFKVLKVSRVFTFLRLSLSISEFEMLLNFLVNNLGNITSGYFEGTLEIMQKVLVFKYGSFALVLIIMKLLLLNLRRKVNIRY